MVSPAASQTLRIQAVIKSPSFVDDVDERTLLLFVKDHRLDCDEVDLFKAVCKWGIAQCHRKGLQPTAGNLRVVLAPMIPYVRFPTMSVDQLATTVMQLGTCCSSFWCLWFVVAAVVLCVWLLKCFCLLPSYPPTRSRAAAH